MKSSLVIRTAIVTMVFLTALLLASGCNKQDAGSSAAAPTAPSGAPAGGGPGGSGGMMGGGPGGSGMMGRGPGRGRGGRGGPVAATATGEEIYQQKCGCHGPGGKGGKAPTLVGGAGKSDDELFKIVHDGKDKMPSFAGQLTDDQIKKVVAAVKGFK